MWTVFQIRENNARELSYQGICMKSVLSNGQKKIKKIEKLYHTICGSASQFDPAKRRQFKKNLVYFDNLVVRVLS